MKMQDNLPKATGTIGLITLKMWFVNLVSWGVCFLRGVRQESSHKTDQTNPQDINFPGFHSDLLLHNLFYIFDRYYTILFEQLVRRDHGNVLAKALLYFHF